MIATGVPAGTVDLLRIAAEPATVGFLYNFRTGSTVYAYQSGPQKNGLSSHAAAIARYQAQGMGGYDFLAGDRS